MAVRNPLVLVNGVLAELPSGDTVNGAGASSGLALTTVEADLGSTPRWSGKFTITGAGMTIGKPVYIQQAIGPYTGKGTLADEAEMDQLNLSAGVVSAVAIDVYWTSNTKAAGNFKFNYFIGS